VLDNFLKSLDGKNYDHLQSTELTKDLREFAQHLEEKGEKEQLALLDLDNEAFRVQKSFDIKADSSKGTLAGLGWQTSGTRTEEDGSVVPFHWPNVVGYQKTQFEYFEKRFKESKSLFFKTEYGLLVYFGGLTSFSKHNDFKKQLCSEIASLSKEYGAKFQSGETRYGHYFLHALKTAFYIAQTSRLQQELDDLCKLLFKIHQEWDVSQKSSQRVLLDISSLMIDNFGLFKTSVDFEKVIEKNLASGKELSKDNFWGAMYAIDRNIAIEQKLHSKVSNETLKFKASLYEALSDEALESGNPACVGFTESALRIYERISDVAGIKKMEDAYNALRGRFFLTEHRQELPQEFSEKTWANIEAIVSESGAEDILQYLRDTPWYPDLKYVGEQAERERSESILMGMIPVVIVDKYGNRVDVFLDEDEKKKHSFWNAYGSFFQVGTQTMAYFFNAAYNAGKLNYETVTAYLEKTWLNEEIIRDYNGRKVAIKPLDTLRPGIRRLFSEIALFLKDNEHLTDYVSVVDSLTLKIESLLRNFCERKGIATFKTREKNGEKLMMEKLIDDILADISDQKNRTGFDEQDRMFIKYVLTEKVGWNLRNSVAHGLLDFDEYDFVQTVVLLSIILKLSRYNF